MTEAAGNDQPGERRGVVHWQPEGIGGEPAPDVDGFQTWLDDFLNGTLAQDKILKIIAAPGDHEGHLLVGVSWSAPWAVIRLLQEDIDVLPVKAPGLPAEVGHLWIWVCQSSGRALAWTRERGWFDVARSWVTE